MIKNKQTVEEMLHRVKYINGPRTTAKTFRRTLEFSKMQIETTMWYDYITTRMFKLKDWKYSSVGKSVGQLECSQNAKRYYSHLERRLAVSYKVKHTLATVPAIRLLVIYSREIKTHVLVLSLSLWHTIIWGSQKLEKTQVPTSRGKDTQTAVYSFNGKLLSKRMDQTSEK